VNRKPKNKRFGKSPKPGEKCLKRIKFYLSYQIAFFVGVCVYVSLYFKMVLNNLYGKNNDSGTTLALTFFLNDIMKLANIIILLVSVRMKEGSLYRIVKDVRNMNIEATDYGNSRLAKNFAYVLFILFILSSIAVIVTTIVKDAADDPESLAENLCVTFAMILLQVAFLFFYWTTIVLTTDTYKPLFLDIDGFHNSMPVSKIKTVSRLMRKSRKLENAANFKISVDRYPKSLACLDDHHQPEEFIQKLKKHYSILMQSYEIRSCIQDYCGVAFSQLFLYMIFTIILSLFYLTYLNTIDTVSLLISLSHFSTCVTYTAFLVLLPQKVQFHVSSSVMPDKSIANYHQL